MTSIEPVKMAPPLARKKTSAAFRYGFAVLLTVAALLLMSLLKGYARDPLFDLGLAAVVLSAIYGGFGPGALAATLSVLALDYFFIPPLHEFQLRLVDLIRLLIFGFVALLTSTLSARLQEAKAGLEESQHELEHRVEQRTEELSRVNAELIQEVRHRREAEREILDVTNREQRRLGQDLHDGLCQILAGVRLMSEDLKERLASRSAPEAADVERIESRLSDALAQADTVSRGLYPVELDTNGLMSALEELAQKISKIYPVSCRFNCPAPVSVEDSTVANHLYRIAQEAVMNAIKGGKAKRIHIRLSRRGAVGLLSVADNGIGFQNETARNGMGLKLMNYRARMINANLEFHDRSSGGTLMRCVFVQEPP